MYKLQETVKGKLITNRFKDMNSVLNSIWTQYLIAMRLKRAEK